MPTNTPRAWPKCGLAALGHDGDVEVALGVDVPTSASALPIQELHHELGTRFVVVADDTPRVVFTHQPELLVDEWARCQRDGLVATHNLRSSHLRFPQPWIRSTLLVGVSESPVRCVLADAADVEAFRRFAAVLRDPDGLVDVDADAADGREDLDGAADDVAAAPYVAGGGAAARPGGADEGRPADDGGRKPRGGRRTKD